MSKLDPDIYNEPMQPKSARVSPREAEEFKKLPRFERTTKLDDKVSKYIGDINLDLLTPEVRELVEKAFKYGQIHIEATLHSELNRQKEKVVEWGNREFYDGIYPGCMWCGNDICDCHSQIKRKERFYKFIQSLNEEKV